MASSSSTQDRVLPSSSNHHLNTRSPANANTDGNDETQLFPDISVHGPIGNDTFTIECSTTVQRCKALRILDFREPVESIDDRAYYNCWSLRKLRIPPTVHSIGASAFANCWELRSIELPERILSHNVFRKLSLCFHNDDSVAIHDAAFNLCHSLRNIALPRSTASDIEIPATAFVGCAELKKHFPHEEDLMKALKHRFDGLPIHKLCYYQSHYPLGTTIRDLEKAIATERRKRQHGNICDGCGGVFGMNQNLLQQLPWPPTSPRLEDIETMHFDRQQDSLGMTPTHILACSVHQSLDLYELLIDFNPTDLITKDKWGDYPLLYAYQTHAPLESVMLLLQSQKRIFPDHKIEWVSMIKKMCVNHASLESIRMIIRSHGMIQEQEESDWKRAENAINLQVCIQDRFWFWKFSFPVLQFLVQYQEANFPSDIIRWHPLVKRLMNSPHWLKDLSMDKIVFLLHKGTASRRSRLGLDLWKEEVISTIVSVDLSSSHQTFAEKRAHVKRVLARLKQLELREMAALLELAIWKKEWKHPSKEEEKDSQYDADQRQECLYSCGAEIVIANVLPLISKSPSKLAMQRRNRSIGRERRRRRRRIAEYVMNEI